MKNITKSSLDFPGIYKLYFKETSHFYIGSSSTSLFTRLSNHRTLLRSNKHQNTFLQNCFNKYSEEKLDFEILELLQNKSTFEILKREQFFINTLKPDLNLQKLVVLKNYCKNNENNQGSNNGSAIFSDEEVENIKGFISQTIDGKTIKCKFGISAPSLTQLRYLKSWKHIKPNKELLTIYEITSPEGRKYRYWNLYLARKVLKIECEVCRLLDNANQHIKDSSSYLKGWKCRVIKYPKIILKEKLKYCKNIIGGVNNKQNYSNQYERKNYVLISPEGKEFRPTYFTRFCKDFNLNWSHLRKVATGERNHHKKWKCRIDY